MWGASSIASILFLDTNLTLRLNLLKPVLMRILLKKSLYNPLFWKKRCFKCLRRKLKVLLTLKYFVVVGFILKLSKKLKLKSSDKATTFSYFESLWALFSRQHCWFSTLRSRFKSQAHLDVWWNWVKWKFLLVITSKFS